MRALAFVIVLFVFSSYVIGQTDLQKLVDTEHAFARLAAEQGTRAAFLANMADDALIFNPDRIVAKPFWTARPNGPGLLSWAPNYADVSSNGMIGYTTGNWEFRPKGKDDVPAGFGEFITVWVRQPDGKYRFVVDIGVGHDKPVKFSSEYATSMEKVKDANENNSSPADVSNGFLQTAEEIGLAKAYSLFGSDELHMFREGKAPIIGKKEVQSALKGDKATVRFARKSTFFGSGDISFNLGAYTISERGKVTEKGNSLQIWKLIRGTWQIVLDILKPVPAN